MPEILGQNVCNHFWHFLLTVSIFFRIKSVNSGVNNPIVDNRLLSAPAIFRLEAVDLS